MKILAIESSQKQAGIALLNDDVVLQQFRLPGNRSTAQFLIPSIGQLLNEFEVKPSALDLIVVSNGPGSFTSIRIGLTAAKTLAYATGCRILSIGSMEVIAAQAFAHDDWNSGTAMWGLINAQRSELFACKLVCDGAWRMSIAVPVTIVEPARLAGMIEPSDFVSGPDLERVSNLIGADRNYKWVNSQLRQPSAATLGTLGWHRLKAGEIGDKFLLAPEYYRQSAAEEKRISR